MICSFGACPIVNWWLQGSMPQISTDQDGHGERLFIKWRRPKDCSPHTQNTSWVLGCPGERWQIIRGNHISRAKAILFFFVYNPYIYLNIMLRGASVVRNTARLTVGKSSRLYTVRCHWYSLSNSLLMLIHHSPSDFTPAPLQSKKRRPDQLERSSYGPLF